MLHGQYDIRTRTRKKKKKREKNTWSLHALSNKRITENFINAYAAEDSANVAPSRSRHLQTPGNSATSTACPFPRKQEKDVSPSHVALPGPPPTAREDAG